MSLLPARPTSRRDLLATAATVASIGLVSACARPDEKSVASAPATTAAVNLESPRGLSAHGTRAPQGADGVAAFVGEQLIVRDGTTLEGVIGHLRASEAITQDADIAIDAPGLDEVVQSSFEAGSPLELSKEATVVRFGDRPDGESVCERSVTLSLRGVFPLSTKTPETSSYAAVLYLVLVAAKGSWRASGVRALQFAPA